MTETYPVFRTLTNGLGSNSLEFIKHIEALQKNGI